MRSELFLCLVLQVRLYVLVCCRYACAVRTAAVDSVKFRAGTFQSVRSAHCQRRGASCFSSHRSGTILEDRTLRLAVAHPNVVVGTRDVRDRQLDGGTRTFLQHAGPMHKGFCITMQHGCFSTCCTVTGANKFNSFVRLPAPRAGLVHVLRSCIRCRRA